MDKYDTREAIHLLANARERKYPHLYAEKRAQAARELLATVLELAAQVGFRVSKDAKDGADVILPEGAGSGAIRLVADPEGVHVGFTAAVSLPVPVGGRVLDFDAVDGRWVGRHSDHAIAPISGELIPRQSAVAALSAQIVEALKAFH